MCLGIQHVHACCHHAKNFDVVEPCHNSATSTACTNLTTLHVITINAPALCVACYREKEAMIDAEYENIKRDLESEIARVDESGLQRGGGGGGGLTDERGSDFLDGYRDE
ncbi:MAG: hypothetical protein ALECFALPRED_003416 [Alectoria fallacina]|uniref:Uncharacterized protein n=1 Tax=Alectoria fallacina TaxID=1903189 RepID=A0A8H3IP58_9LECA|nr:MAG: hypothetical protein ALECFALPRED_003416 [Alectoria fallacina]